LVLFYPRWWHHLVWFHPHEKLANLIGAIKWL
jgi:hypothetical protein